VQVARIFNVTESSVYGWQKAYREGGLAALSTKIASGRKRLLTDKQMLELSGYLRLNLASSSSISACGPGGCPRADQGEIQDRLLGTERRPDPEDARLLPQRPVYQALERNEGKRRKWMEETFPAIKERARRRGEDLLRR